MDKKGKQYLTMNKRKRLDARSFREWHISQAKKHKISTNREPTAERSDGTLHDCDNNFEARCLSRQECGSETCHPYSKQQRIVPEVNPQSCTGEAVNEQYGSKVHEDSSSTDVQLQEVTGGALGEMVEGEGGNLGTQELGLGNHEKILSCMESASDRTNKDAINGVSNCRVSRSEDLSDSKPSSWSSIEYWVPVDLSHLQLEKYCETLIINSMLLCSGLKRGTLDGLHDALIMIRKCCDHPYLVDPSLEKFITKGRQTDHLSTGIEASGKLLLLEKILQEAKKNQLRVVIVFQSNTSKSQLHLRHILDDFILQRFGEGSYVHIYREFDHTKRRTALDLFNDKESGKFLILLEKSSCQSSIKLSAVDFVILFNSDWNPINDIRSLQKMSIQSKPGKLKVLRLYTSNSVEEKALILAKDNTALVSTLPNFNLNICHMLLRWGASYLFNKLDNFHSICSSLYEVKNLSEHAMVCDVLHELSVLLSCQESNKSNCSLISIIPEATDGYFANILLYGEKIASSGDDKVPHSSFWINLLEGKNPRWKLLSESSQRTKRKVEVFDNSSPISECKTVNHPRICKKDLNSRIKTSCLKQRLGKSWLTTSRRSAAKVAGGSNYGGSGAQMSPSKAHISTNDVEENFNRRMQMLLRKQKRDICEFNRFKREEWAKLEGKCLLEMDSIPQRCKETAEKQVELLDRTFQEKFKEYSHQMDIRKKKLHDVHKASRIEEKLRKCRSVNKLMMTNLANPISSLAHAPLLNSELELEMLSAEKNQAHIPLVISDSTLLSERQPASQSEKNTHDGSCHLGESELPSCQLLSETEILSAESDGENDATFPRVAISSNVEGENPIVFDNGASTSASPCEEHSQKLMCTSHRGIETEILSLSVESNGENDAASIPILAASSTSECNNPILVSENGASTVASHSEEQSQNLKFESRSVMERNCSENIQPLLEGSQGVTGVHSLGYDGGNELLVMTSEKHSSSIEPSNDVSDLSNSNENRLLSALESLTNLPNSDLEATAGPTGRGTNMGRADFETIGTVTEHQSTGDLADLPQSQLTRGSCMLNVPQTSSTSSTLLPLEQGLLMTEVTDLHSDIGDHSNFHPKASVNESMESGRENNLEGHLTPSNLPSREVQNVDNNEDTLVVACNAETEGTGAANVDIDSTVSRLQGIETVRELPSSGVDMDCFILEQPQPSTGNSSALEQQKLSANHPCDKIGQALGSLAVTNSIAPKITTLTQPDQVQVPVNSGSCDLSVPQPIAIAGSTLLSDVNHDQPHVLSRGFSTLRPASSYSQDWSYLTSNITPSTGRDPLHNELVRMEKELEEVMKIHGDKMLHLRFTCEKEIEEIRMKHDLLLRESENSLLLKKQELETCYNKVLAHKLLAETLQYDIHDQLEPTMSQATLPTNVYQLSTPQHQLVGQRSMPIGAPMAPPVQVVHQISDLISVDQPRPPNRATIHMTRNPLVDHQRWATINHMTRNANPFVEYQPRAHAHSHTPQNQSSRPPVTFSPMFYTSAPFHEF